MFGPTRLPAPAAAFMMMLVLVLGTTLLSSAPAQAATAAQEKYANSAFRATNNVREARDKVRLKHSKCLQRFANKQAVKLADLGELVHQALEPILEECNLNLTGENLAIGFASGRKTVRDGWMKSPAHKANIVERRYRVMAIAARKTPLGLWVCVQLFGRKA